MEVGCYLPNIHTYCGVCKDVREFISLCQKRTIQPNGGVRRTGLKSRFIAWLGVISLSLTFKRNQV